VVESNIALFAVANGLRVLIAHRDRAVRIPRAALPALRLLRAGRVELGRVALHVQRVGVLERGHDNPQAAVAPSYPGVDVVGNVFAQAALHRLRVVYVVGWLKFNHRVFL
jgi:hypothetical protein